MIMSLIELFTSDSLPPNNGTELIFWIKLSSRFTIIEVDIATSLSK